ncbi:MAG: hypothetical protein PHW24_00020 [Candidatus Moranbacteria bacterium]|nr:hypothetical protein [Candidatus Moranbacteria bacterium]
MRIKNISISKETFLIIYKLLFDALLLACLTFGGALLAEGLLPGIISSKISFTNITVSLIAILAAIIYLGKNLDITYDQAKLHKGKVLSALVFFSFLLIGNSMLKFTLWENIVITLTTLLFFFLFYELLFASEAE